MAITLYAYILCVPHLQAGVKVLSHLPKSSLLRLHLFKVPPSHRFNRPLYLSIISPKLIPLKIIILNPSEVWTLGKSSHRHSHPTQNEYDRLHQILSRGTSSPSSTVNLQSHEATSITGHHAAHLTGGYANSTGSEMRLCVAFCLEMFGENI